MLVKSILLLIYSTLFLLAPHAIGQADAARPTGSESAATSAPCEGAACPVQAETPAVAVTEEELDVAALIGVEELAAGWERGLGSMLDNYGLASSLFGRLLASLAVIMVALLLTFLLRFLINRLFHYLIKLKIRFHFSLQRMALYKRVLTLFVHLLMLGLTLSALVVVWGGGAIGLWLGQQLLGLLSIVCELAVLFAVAVVIFEFATATMEYYFNRWSSDASPRVKTLLPIAKNVTNAALFIIFGITVISELGIDVMPLLAGAGVIGFAIGFGAQTLIKDLITGFIIIFEDLIQVGDVASVGGKSGVVEKITIRKVQLRNMAGTVFTVPFSEITIVENLTKDFSHYVFDIGIAYRESPDEVVQVLKQIDAELREDAEFKDDILDPLEVMGVDQFADSAIILKARIKTKPIKQWRIGREFNRRMKYAFDKHGIEIPFPHQTLYFGEDKTGKAPPVRIEVQQPSDAASDLT